MIGLSNNEVVGLVKDVARLSNSVGNLEQALVVAHAQALWYVAERDALLAEIRAELEAMVKGQKRKS